MVPEWNIDRYNRVIEKRYANKLKGCPFCNCSARIERTHTKYWWVECENCGCQSGSRYGAKNAVELWNQRSNFSLRP